MSDAPNKKSIDAVPIGKSRDSAKHTPGPWVVCDVGELSACIVRADDKHDFHAKVYHCDVGDREANVRLIAAAPEMYEALKRIRDARDHNAEHGEYPEGSVGRAQQFDDWAADVASAALAKVGAAC